MWYRIAQIQPNEKGTHAFQYQRNPEKAPFLGNIYRQDIEPHGKYVTQLPEGASAIDGWEQGNIEFTNPLVIYWGSGGYKDPDNWKQLLSEKYQKTGKELSEAIIADGYDGIITVDDRGEPMEIIDLAMFKNFNQI
jgi:hypothetical protein